jgi:hypothetical protein
MGPWNGFVGDLQLCGSIRTWVTVGWAWLEGQS